MHVDFIASPYPLSEPGGLALNLHSRTRQLSQINTSVDWKKKEARSGFLFRITD